ncbi:MAG: PAS domain-containing protein [Desulfovibrionales bacterium]
MKSLPVEVTFVDDKDTVANFNRLDKKKVFTRTRSVVGRKVLKCHPAQSVDTVLAIVEGFKNKTRDKAEFWIDFKGDKILIRYFPVYSDEGTYMGVLEVTEEIGRIQELKGQKRLLD